MHTLGSNGRSLISNRHMFWTTKDQEEEVNTSVDRFSDSYARDTTVDELKGVRSYSRLALFCFYD